MKKARIIGILAAVVLVGAGTLVVTSGKKDASPAKTQSYEYATVGRGSLESVVSSSGTLAVLSSVSVLSQMSGRVESVRVDFNDRVKKGQVLATLNTDMLKLQEKVSQAAVDKAEASYRLQTLAAQNAQTLAAKGLLSDYDLKTAQANLDSSKADLASVKAALEQIQTQIEQYAIISSPIDGIVLQRDIDVGQSVLGGSSATSTALFTLTDDLSKMQIDAQVDELDISGITMGQAVHFSVEAYPNHDFSGTVKEIRLVPVTTNNVVYYDVMIDAFNKSGKLLPGMTASVSFVKDKKEGILVVPSAALRFTPTSLSAAEVKKEVYLAGLGQLTPEQRQEAEARYDAAQKASASKSTTSASSGLTSLLGGSRMGGPGFGPPGGPQGGSGQQGTKAAAGTAAPIVKKPLWYLDDAGRLAVSIVEPGLSDGLSTEIIGAEALEGKKVIVKIKAE